MSGSTDRTSRLLRCYPPAWRRRYGDEFVLLMEDELDGGPATPRFMMSIAWAGMRERLVESGLVGAGPSPTDRGRVGSLVVLCAWAVFVLGGAVFSKTSEHFAQALPTASQTQPQDAFDLVVGLAVTGAVLVGLGAVAALPAFVHWIRDGGWSVIRTHVIRGAALTAVTVGTLLPLSVWAHHLGALQRNGADPAYSAAFVAWALLAAVTMIQWTVAGVVTARRLELSRRALLVEELLAVAVAGSMVVMTAATAWWWAAMASSAPWFIGMAPWNRISVLNPQLLLVLALMTGAAIAGVYGVIRIVPTLKGTASG